MTPTRSDVDVFRPETWEDLVIPFEDVTPAQADEQFCHHAATGGDLIFLTTGEKVAL